MQWKQFFTPVKSLNPEESRSYLEKSDPGEVEIIDVRQPSEYEQGHIPGAKLIPLPVLGERMGEIDPSKTSMVYCAVGGRSRVAAQMLSGKGFKNVINVSGGYKAWQGDSAYGEETLGLELFTGKEDPAKILSVAYSLEQGLREFYLSMIASVQEASVKKLFQKLSDIETLHQERIFNQYKELSQEDITREEFEAGQVARAVEGGLTTREYLARFNADLTSPRDVIALAMSIEAQALDMYLRVSRNIVSEKGRAAIEDIADEERVHLASLGNLMDQV